MTPELRKKLDRIGTDPRPGDKVWNNCVLDHATRTVTDTTLGGDVCYLYHERLKWRAVCSASDWLRFCSAETRIRVLREGKKK